MLIHMCISIATISIFIANLDFLAKWAFGSEVAAEKEIEIASRALNHSDTQVTRDHYIVPEDSDLDFEFENKKTNLENIETHREKKKEII